MSMPRRCNSVRDTEILLQLPYEGLPRICIGLPQHTFSTGHIGSRCYTTTRVLWCTLAWPIFVELDRLNNSLNPWFTSRQTQISPLGWLECWLLLIYPMGPLYLFFYLRLAITNLCDLNAGTRNVRTYYIVHRQSKPVWVLRPTQGHAYNETPFGTTTT